MSDNQRPRPFWGGTALIGATCPYCGDDLHPTVMCPAIDSLTFDTDGHIEHVRLRPPAIPIETTYPRDDDADG